MKHVILASHGDLSSGMLHTLKMIVGDLPCPVETFSLYPGASALDYALTIEEEAKQHPEDEYVVITDVLGGSVHTSMLQALHSKNIVLFAGMNLALVLEIAISANHIQGNEESFAKTGKDGIVFMEHDLLTKTEAEEF